MTSYKVLTGLNYPADKGGDEKRADPGDVVTDLPTKSVKWLLDGGHIEPVKSARTKPAEGGEE